jgi:hypothetical protein
MRIHLCFLFCLLCGAHLWGSAQPLSPADSIRVNSLNFGHREVFSLHSDAFFLKLQDEELNDRMIRLGCFSHQADTLRGLFMRERSYSHHAPSLDSISWVPLSPYVLMMYRDRYVGLSIMRTDFNVYDPNMGILRAQPFALPLKLKTHYFYMNYFTRNQVQMVDDTLMVMRLMRMWHRVLGSGADSVVNANEVPLFALYRVSLESPSPVDTFVNDSLRPLQYFGTMAPELAAYAQFGAYEFSPYNSWQLDRRTGLIYSNQAVDSVIQVFEALSGRLLSSIPIRAQSHVQYRARPRPHPRPALYDSLQYGFQLLVEGLTSTLYHSLVLDSARNRIYLLQTQPEDIEWACAKMELHQMAESWGTNWLRNLRTRNRLLTYDLATRRWLPEHEFAAPVYKLVGVDSRGRLWAEDLTQKEDIVALGCYGDPSLTLYGFDVP